MKTDEEIVNNIINEIVRYEPDDTASFTGNCKNGEWVEYTEFKRLLKKALSIQSNLFEKKLREKDEQFKLEKKALEKKLRKAIAEYMHSEGCDCCQDVENHKKHKKILANLLNVPVYKDKSGYDFDKFRKKYKGV